MPSYEGVDRNPSLIVGNELFVVDIVKI